MFLSTWEWIRLLGFLAYFYFTVSLIFGLLRKTPAIQSNKNLYFQLHQNAGWMGFIAVIAHMLLLIIDQYEPYQIAEILIPFLSDYHAVFSGFGTIAFYLFLIVFVTSDLLIRKMDFSIWKKVHMLVLPAWILSLMHGLFIGTDSKNTLVLLFYGATVTIVAITLLIRVISEEYKKKEKLQQKNEMETKALTE
ncbi:ferric reductase-like transmembrane domain-containing protein [Lysinibacillus sp. LZ02]|uniref:ferric reductase-like transmembrane domain-containing protein n=1 Tax=Lysinibacillus sp. LZ02 TaxID=3420668 RepID=UPI003D367FEE